MILISHLSKAATRLSTYASNDEPLAAAGNKVALVLAGNMPFYPIYVVGLAGSEGMPALLMTLFAFPVFAVVPAISRRRPLLGRAILSLAGSVNTLFCTWLLGERSGTELFLIPCITLASLVFGTGERGWMLPLAALPLGAYILLHGHYGSPPHLYQDAAYVSLFSMNAISVGTLSIFLGMVFSGLYAGPSKRAN
jgi:MASE7